MPGKKPGQRLVYLQKKKIFRYVKTPDSMRPGPNGIKWSSCNSTMNGGSGKGGGAGKGGPVFQTAYGVSYLGWKYQRLGEGIVTTGLIFATSIIGAVLTLPAFIVGAGINAYGGTMTAKFTRPCSESAADDNRNKY